MTGKPLLTRAEIVEQRQTRIAARTAKQQARGVKKVNKGARFPDLVNEPLRRFVRGLPCILEGLTDGAGITHVCRGSIVVAHLKTKGSSGPDDNNVFPACWLAHAQQEGRTEAFQARWGQRLAAICRKVTARWLREQKEAP